MALRVGIERVPKPVGAEVFADVVEQGGQPSCGEGWLERVLGDERRQCGQDLEKVGALDGRECREQGFSRRRVERAESFAPEEAKDFRRGVLEAQAIGEIAELKVEVDIDGKARGEELRQGEGSVARAP